MDSYLEQQQINAEINNLLQQYKHLGAKYATSEKNYRIALAKEILMLRTDGMAVTVIPDLARGQPNVAQLKFLRDCAKAEYESLKEAVYTKRLQLKIAREETAEDRRGM